MPPVPTANELENVTMKAWISDASGIKEETNLEDANVHALAEGAKWWVKKRYFLNITPQILPSFQLE